MLAELEKLEENLGGVADMRRQPDAIFIVDLRKEQLAVREARRLGLPVIALVDTNCDPDEEDGAAAGGHVPREVVGLLEQLERLLEVDDVDAAALREDEAAHLGIPAARLVAEVDSGLQELAHRDDWH